MFDDLLESVLAELPSRVTDLLEEIPLIVEDYPSDDVLDDLGVDPDDDTAIDNLCGLHSGIPLTERSVMHSGTMPDTIHVFRNGVLNLATGPDGYVDEAELRRQIRITVLHEIGHHFGLDEDDLRNLGYA